MIETLYIEEQVRTHPRVQWIAERFGAARHVLCERYTEIFNPKTQNFRLQKRKPALILAAKHGHFVLPTPPAYGLGGAHNYYFSHLLNCIYDCRYCFLQGMYPSANYVLFVNYEDFQSHILQIIKSTRPEEPYFFSGYDCDSLALEPITGFARTFMDFFRVHPEAHLELRTKSTQIRQFLQRDALPNVIIAFSFTPEVVSRRLEHKVPAMERRVRALQKLQARNWRLGLRFDPMIYTEDYQSAYRALFTAIFTALNPHRIDSVSFGSFRLPERFFHKMRRLYPRERLFADPHLAREENMVSYTASLRNEMLEFCSRQLGAYVPPEKIFCCA